ncbi:protein deadlock [Drosophila sechellia]|uniref:GM13366 n=1 Tax=Drosophila sechellia TaxID=7238 RepID=B4IET2_DROSE|nr:protein deadlock [Drosophila sechellia]EDW46186.1 GM13366 [Drosophila sechellia]
MKNSAKISMSQKLACWQQIRSMLGTSYTSEENWDTHFKDFLESWEKHPDPIQSRSDPRLPLILKHLEDLQENPHGPVAALPESPVCVDSATNSTAASREHPNPSKSLDSSVNSTD